MMEFGRCVMALEALWTVDFGAVAGGVIVLKGGQIFGGDGARYYVGTFTAKGTKLEGQLSIAWYFGPRKTVWGRRGEGRRDQGDWGGRRLRHNHGESDACRLPSDSLPHGEAG
jgi:hypothetical protein